MMTNAQQCQALLDRLDAIESEKTSIHRQLRELHHDMGHPPKEQIASAARDGKSIVRGCTEP